MMDDDDDDADGGDGDGDDGDDGCDGDDDDDVDGDDDDDDVDDVDYGNDEKNVGDGGGDDPSSPKGNGKTQTPKRGGAPKGGKGDKPGPKAHPKGKAKGGLISTQHDTDAGMVIADGVDAVSRLFDTSYNAADWTSSMTLRELCLGASPDSAQADKVYS